MEEQIVKTDRINTYSYSNSNESKYPKNALALPLITSNLSSELNRQNSLNKLKTPKSNYLNINNNEYMTEVSNKSNKENEVPIRSVKSMKKNDIPTPIRNQTSFGLKRMQSSRSPFVALKQNLSNKFKNVEIENIDKIGNIVREHHSGK